MTKNWKSLINFSILLKIRKRRTDSITFINYLAPKAKQNLKFHSVPHFYLQEVNIADTQLSEITILISFLPKQQLDLDFCCFQEKNYGHKDSSKNWKTKLYMNTMIQVNDERINTNDFLDPSFSAKIYHLFHQWAT